MDHNNILGVVLAGGKSQRFGEDKSQAKLHGKILIDYIISEIIDEFNEILIVTNNNIKFNKSDKISTTKDFKEGLGPLGGILTAMRWVKNEKKNYKWISSFPSDTPFFTKEELHLFYKNIDIQKSKLFFIKNKKTRHNIFGLWSIDLMDKLELDLEKGERKVEIWADSVGVKMINIDFKKKDPFFNINTKKDLEIAHNMKKND